MRPSHASCRSPTTRPSRAIPQQLRRWLESVDGLGFGVLSGVPVESGEVARVAELFGHVRMTNYGRVFDVRAVVEPANLAYTPLGLGPHTTTLTATRADAAAAALPLVERQGGENTLVDGFCVAEALRAARPGDFALLARPPRDFAVSRRAAPS